MFAAAMAPGNPPLLRVLEEKARADGVPVIRQGTQSLIRFLLELKKPQRILEVGTGVGFSALLMLDALHGACEITTIEKDPARAAEAELDADRHFSAGASAGAAGAAAASFSSSGSFG